MLRTLLLLMPLLRLAAQEDPGVITTNQAITPAGVQSVFRGRVYGVTFGANPSEVWVLTSGEISHFDWKSNRIIEKIETEGAAGLQGIRFDRAGNRVLVTGTRKNAKALKSG